MSLDGSIENMELSFDEASDEDLTDASTVSLDGSILASGEEYEIESFSDASEEDGPINASNQWTTVPTSSHRLKHLPLRNMCYGKCNTAPEKIARTSFEQRTKFTTTIKGKSDLRKQEKQVIKGVEMSVRFLEKKLDHFTVLGANPKRKSRIPLEHKFPLKYFYRAKNNKCKCNFCSYCCDLEDSEKIRLAANHLKSKHRIID